jgi:uncharacterized protein (TIGR03000 family)
MRRRLTSLSLVLVATTIFLVSTPNFAKAWAPGGYGGYYGGYYPYYGYGYGYYGYPSYGYAYGYRPYFGYHGSYYSPYYYSPYYANSTYPYYVSSYYYPYNTAYSAYYPYTYTAPAASTLTTVNASVAVDDSAIAPDGMYYASAPLPPQDNKAHFAVRVPDPYAELTVNGQVTSSVGAVRYYQSPPLEPGRYAYEMKIKWVENGKTMSQTKTVTFNPNTRNNIDFTENLSASR